MNDIPTRYTVPAAKIQFLPEDREWIAGRIAETLETGQLTLGKYGRQFEEAFAKLCGCRHAVAVSSGTSALEIILRTIGVEGKDVLVPTNTFFATAAAVIHAGGRPVLMDTDQKTFSVTPEDAAERITRNTAAMIVVHIGGIVTNRILELRRFCDDRSIRLVEDAAHAHGSSFNGVMAGAFGQAAAFSFYPTKVMTSGEGGMIVTNDETIAEESRIYRDQGKAGFFRNEHIRMGSNWRMSEPHAIIGLRHLQRIGAMISDRQRAAAVYDRALSGYERLVPLMPPPESVCNYYKYIAIPEPAIDRKAFRSALRERYQVSLSGEVYESPIHLQPVFAPYNPGNLPLSEKCCARHICLPVYAGMTDGEAEWVAFAVRDLLEKEF